MIMTENSLRQPLRYEVDLSTGLVQTPLRTQLMRGDKQANTIIVKLTNGGKSVDLTGVQVSGSFIRPGDGAAILLTGEAEGNEARVILRDECYEQDGFFEANVKLLLGNVERTVLSITGNVLRKGSGEYVEITGVIPSVEDILSQYETMKRVTEETQEAADKANEAASRAPYIDEETGTWHVWSTEAGKYVDTGSIAAGPQGIPGATPYVGENGNWWIGETDTGTPATGPEGKQGPKGDQGDGLKILGLYGTLAALQSAHPTGSAGDAYSVGTPEDNEVYIWDVDAGAWKNLGALQGPPGPEGPRGDDYNLTDADKQEIAGMAAGMVPAPKIELDTTLKEAGKAADAKATGDALNQLSQQMVNYRTAVNLLDNSDFRTPVNQRGITWGTACWTYFIDRWLLVSVSGGNVTFDVNTSAKEVGFSTENGEQLALVQRFSKGIIDTTQIYTTAYKIKNGSVVVRTAEFNTDSESYDALNIWLDSGTYLEWVALYEGEYTVETLPPYVPKGYAAELAECQRYYRFYRLLILIKESGSDTWFGVAGATFDMANVSAIIIGDVLNVASEPLDVTVTAYSATNRDLSMIGLSKAEPTAFQIRDVQIIADL